MSIALKIERASVGQCIFLEISSYHSWCGQRPGGEEGGVGGQHTSMRKGIYGNVGFTVEGPCTEYLGLWYW